MTETHADRIRDANARLLVDGELDAIDVYFDPGYTVHLTEKDIDGGHAFVARVVRALRKAFDDVAVEVEILLEGESAEGAARVAWQRTVRGTHNGTFAGFPATGARLVWRDVHVTAFVDGRITEEWVASDLAEALLAAR